MAWINVVATEEPSSGDIFVKNSFSQHLIEILTPEM